MFDRIKTLFSGTADPDTLGHDFEAKQLAAAALLVEAAHLDGAFGERERAAMAASLKRFFGLSDDDVAALIAAAGDAQADASHLQRFTRVLKEAYEPQERVELIEMLWEVVYADGILDDYEGNLLRRIGGLLYVTERERGEARKRVLARFGLDGR